MTSPERPNVQLSAYEDIAEIDDRLRRAAGAAAAEKTTGLILDGIDLLGPTPYLGPLHHDPMLARMGYRKLVRGSYIVVYRVIDGRAVVFRVFHGASDYTRRIEF